MREWTKLENGDEVMESKLWRLRCFDFLGGQAFSVEVKTEDGDWARLYMSSSGTSPREVAKEAALVALSWYRDTMTGFPMKPAQNSATPTRQKALAEWQARELPCEDAARQRLRLALGVAEEAGEVARCVLKGDQDIRGGSDVWRAKLGGEIGDVVIYLIQLATVHGLDFEECVEGATRKVLARRFASADKDQP